jgi:hypothetical protein
MPQNSEHEPQSFQSPQTAWIGHGTIWQSRSSIRFPSVVSQGTPPYIAPLRIERVWMAVPGPQDASHGCHTLQYE